MKRLLFFVLTLFTLLSAGAAGKERTYTLHPGDFTRLKVLDNAHVVYKCNPDSAGLAVYRGEEEFCDSYILTVSGNTLRVQVLPEDVSLPNLPVLTVYSSFLEEASNESNSTLTVVKPAACPKFKARQMSNGSLFVKGLKATSLEAQILTGKGVIEIEGEANSALYKLTGTGRINARGVVAKEVQCRIMGTGSIYLTALSSLKVSGLGSTKIYYWGSPELVKKSGGAKLFDMVANPDARQ